MLPEGPAYHLYCPIAGLVLVEVHAARIPQLSSSCCTNCLELFNRECLALQEVIDGMCAAG